MTDPVRKDARSARQGERGPSMLVVLGASLALIVVAFAVIGVVSGQNPFVSIGLIDAEPVADDAAPVADDAAPAADDGAPAADDGAGLFGAGEINVADREPQPRGEIEVG